MEQAVHETFQVTEEAKRKELATAREKLLEERRRVQIATWTTRINDKNMLAVFMQRKVMVSLVRVERSIKKLQKEKRREELEIHKAELLEARKCNNGAAAWGARGRAGRAAPCQPPQPTPFGQYWRREKRCVRQFWR